MTNYYFYLVRVGNIVNSGVLTTHRPPDEAFQFLKSETFSEFPEYTKQEFLFEKFELMPYDKKLNPTLK